jgi:hypothetical protein
MYGIDFVVIRAGVATALKKRWQEWSEDGEHYVIGFAGSLYATDAWEALLQALHSVGWRIAGRTVIIRMFGQHLQITTRQPVRVDYMGWRSAEEMIELLGDVDVCYLPYWFGAEHELEVQLAFPGKLSTYLGAGRPVFFHGPGYASVAAFFKRFPAGLCCHSLSETEIVAGLSRLATDGEFRRLAWQAAERALEQELSMTVFQQRFARLIGIDPALLSPPR